MKLTGAVSSNFSSRKAVFLFSFFHVTTVRNKTWYVMEAEMKLYVAWDLLDWLVIVGIQERKRLC